MDPLQEQMQHVLHDLQALGELLEVGEFALFRFLCQRCVHRGLATLAWVGIAEETPGKTVRVVASWPQEHPYLQHITIRWSLDPLGEGPTGRALRTGKVQISPYMDTDTRMGPWQKAALRYHFRSSAAIPFTLPDGIKVVLNLYHPRGGAYLSLKARLQELQHLLHQVAPLCHQVHRGRITEQAFRITAHRLSHLLDVMQEVFYIVEYPERNPPGRVVYVSPNVKSLLGVEPERFLRDPQFWYSLIHPADRPHVQRSLERLLHHTGAEVRRYRLRHPATGAVLWVEDRSRAEWDEQARVLRVYGVARDTTEEQESRARAAEHEHLFLAMAEDANVGIFILLMDQPPVFAYMNPFLRRILGLPEEGPVLWEHVQDRLPPETHTLLQEEVDRLLTGELPVIRKTFEVRGGGDRTWKLDLVARRVQIHKRPAIVGIVEDTTQLEQLESQIQQAQKMEVVGRMAAGIAHDFNNLLTLILGHLDLALMDMPEDLASLREDLKIAREAGERATQLTRKLMLLGAPWPEERIPVSWNQLIRQSESIIRSALGDRIRLVLDLQEDLREIEGDPAQLEQVLMNLVINARDAMPEGGTLTLETRNIVRTDTPEGETHFRVPFVRFRVIDTGIGMDEETRARLFEPFFTTKPRGKGTGLGLSTVYRIVQIHRGWIEVESEPGQGSTFTLYFPTTRRNNPGVSPFNSTHPAENLTSRTPLRLLIIEDNYAVLKLLKRSLESKGFVVIPATTLTEGQHLLEQVSPDLLITDVELPDGNGAHYVLDHIRDPGFPPAVVMSGYIQEAAEMERIQQMGIPFLVKPFTLQALFEVIQHILQARERPSGDLPPDSSPTL